jgi:multicomponent Na+:H+ antiporter subunit F
MFALAAAGLLVAIVPAGVVVFRGEPAERVAGLAMVSVVLALLWLALAQALHQQALQDLALALALMSFGGGLVFARFLERWL